MEIGDWNGILRGRLQDWRERGLARELKTAAGTGTHFILDGHPVLSFAANDYLGLSAHPRVVAAAKAALDEFGAGAGASPLIAGHKSIHARLEEKLARFKQSQAALVFPSGYQAALATLGALAGENSTILLDRLAHASLLDGARLSGARVRTFKHNDPVDLARLLDRESHRTAGVSPVQGAHNQRDAGGTIVVIESLYSMDGDLAPLAEFIELARLGGALLIVDEAHATGVLGPSGRGGLEEFSAGPASSAANVGRDAGPAGGLPRHVVALGTLSKALGSQGGFICAAADVVDTVLHAGRSYMFSTALLPAAAAAALAALDLIDSEPQRRAHLFELQRKLRQELHELSFEIAVSDGPIIPLLVRDEKRAVRWSQELLRRGVYVPAIRFPTVKRWQARLRISLSAGHTHAGCAALLKALWQSQPNEF